MKEDEANKQQLSQFGRTLLLVFNRSFMYQANHPYLQESIEGVHEALRKLLIKLTPLVFILNREQFYVDEEPLDPRINVDRMVAHFKKTGIESLSFYKGLEKKEFRLFLEVVTSLNKYPDAESMSKALFRKGVNFIKINHVFYQKVSADDEIVSRDALKKVTPQIMDESQARTKQMFMDTVLESVLMEEFAKTLNLQNLMKRPSGLSKDMIAADLNTAKQNGDQGQSPGLFLLKQLDVIDQEVEKNLSEGGDVDLPEMASALIEMRKKLVEGIEAQKALGIAYSNEEKIYGKANEITDKILLKLIKEEYRSGKITVSRLAQILRRMIPEAEELKRLLPKIKTALLDEGMALNEYMGLLRELGRELQNEELAGILAESSEEIGIEGEDIIKEVKENPVQSAELLYLASEIRKGGGDEKALTDLLVDYVERIGSEASRDISPEEGSKETPHLNNVFTEVKSKLIQHLGKMDIKDDVLARLEGRLNQRMDEVLDKMRLEWVKSQSDRDESEPPRQLTVLETLERSVSEEEHLWEILEMIRSKVDAHEIDENDFGQIYSEINNLDRLRELDQSKNGALAGIMRAQGLMTLFEKEVAKSKRYGTPFSALGFSLVKARAKTKPKSGAITNHEIMDALLYRLAGIFRDSDVVGEMRKNKLVALLPMTPQVEAKVALRRALKHLHLKPIGVGGVFLDIKVAGVVADVDFEKNLSATAFADLISIQLMDMATRIRSIHGYS